MFYEEGDMSFKYKFALAVPCLHPRDPAKSFTVLFSYEMQCISELGHYVVDRNGPVGPLLLSISKHIIH